MREREEGGEGGREGGREKKRGKEYMMRWKRKRDGWTTKGKIREERQ